MQKYTSLALLAILITIGACGTPKPAKETNKAPDQITVQVTVKDTTAPDTLRLYAWEGIQVNQVALTTAKLVDGMKTYTFVEQKGLPRGMYYIGESLGDLKPILLGTESMVKLSGDVPQIGMTKVVESKLNLQYEQLMQTIQRDNQYLTTLLTSYAQNKGNEEELNKISKKLAIEDKTKKDRLDSLTTAKSELARIMALNTFQSYQNNGADGQTEGAYFANSFFQFTNLTDSTYSSLPFYYENVKNYARAVTQMNLQKEQQQMYLDTFLSQVPDSNKNHKPTLVGLMLGTMSTSAPLFLRYSAMYSKQYKGDYQMLDNFIAEQTTKLKGPAGQGEAAPEISGANPEGITKNLSQMRGKYVLIDFWASWCGPCRRENPHVVKLYNKYKNKGFEILGVSLDTKKENWKAAIAADNLTWTHVSDLKGWSSELSKPYGVRGIPHTVLVDREGNIIATKLRGAALDATLARLFGE